MNLALLARRKDKIEALAAELSQDDGPTALAIEAGVTDRDSLAATVADRLGGADVLINCAGRTASRSTRS